jgi:hypothetical protein
MGYDLKLVERYDAGCRITQCFKCQKYGHISSICPNAEKCGHCGSDHTTEKCAGVSPTLRKRCAACQGGEHTSWSAECPARVKETLRAKAARAALPKLFPVSTTVPTLREAFGAVSVPATDSKHLSGGSQATENWSTVATKKRKLQIPGRPIGAVSKAKTITKDVNQSIFSFGNQTQQGTRGASDTPASTQPDKSSQMDCDSTLPTCET